MIAHLSDRSVMLIEGADATLFLQGLITNNVALLAQQRAIFSAFLSPQGKFLYDFFVVQGADGLLLETEARQMEGVLALLTKYRLRAKVQFSLLPQWQVYAGWEEESPILPDAVMYEDTRHSTMGWRMISQQPIMHAENVTAYHAHRMQVGIPEGWHDLHYDKSFVLEYGYDALHAIDFSKGCYVGQEVTTRTKYRGVVRKKIVKVQATDGTLPESGTPIISDAGVTVGEMRSHVGMQGLALCRTQEIQTLTPQSLLRAGTCIVTLIET
jgi:folate-binding protein YgfZ